MLMSNHGIQRSEQLRDGVVGERDSTPRDTNLAGKPAGAISILLIDDHEIFLAGTRLLLQREPGLIVIGEACNRDEALEAARRRPDIILLDLDLGSESGEDLLPDLLK